MSSLKRLDLEPFSKGAPGTDRSEFQNIKFILRAQRKGEEDLKMNFHFLTPHANAIATVNVSGLDPFSWQPRILPKPRK